MARLELDLARAEPLAIPGGHRLTIILPCHHRIHNMSPSIRSMLKLPFVERVIVANSKPSNALSDCVPVGDPRIRYEAVFGTKIGVRFAIARRYPAAYYLTIDDDLILRPKQVRDLFLALLRVPEIPHGIRGEVFVGRAFSFNIWVDRKNLELDILNGCFAFTQLHVDRYFELLRALGIENTEQLGNGKT